MPRYVILQHDWNGVHYDLMMEQGAALKTWRLPSLLQPGRQEASLLSDHRLEYLTYEGPVSQNRGNVCRVAEGKYEATLTSEHCWKIVLHGILQGLMTLQHEVGDRWQLDWQPRS